MPDRSANILGDFIRQQRELANLSMRRFSELVGISNPYLSQIENGLRAPSEQVLNGIAQALSLSADALYEQAGLTPHATGEADTAVLDAIAADTRLTARQRSAMREIYNAFVADAPPEGAPAVQPPPRPAKTPNPNAISEHPARR